ncbi:MAG: 4-hydroxy-2-oxovalerate aldolase [Phormidesmis sp. FL-bin-119]|nr:4-hydroxy-2-oxovalerate aldolase [Pedobacter sp.]
MITIVENTLRDGSYVVDFQIDEKQTADIAGGLSKLGFEYIEVGHGLGLGAWNKSASGLSKESDETYILTAKEAAPTAKIGAFFIAGLGTKNDIDLAVDCGLDFIRIGSNIDTHKNTLEYAEYAKNKGLWVAVNLMKSYGVKSYEFKTIAVDIDSWEIADAIYLVDSAGCMIPEEVFEYIDRSKQSVKTSLGFHGHNNLSLAVANTLKAIEGGASYVDTCVRGMGRSAGNAQTEIIVHLLQKMGISPISTDVYKFYDFANEYIVPLMANRQGQSDDEIHIAISRFHTSYMPLATRVALDAKVDLKILIKRVSDINCINPTLQLFKDVAQEIIEGHG